MSEITGRVEARLRRFGDLSVALNQFDNGAYLMTVYAPDTSYQLHLNQEGVDELHALFAKFATAKT